MLLMAGLIVYNWLVSLNRNLANLHPTTSEQPIQLQVEIYIQAK